MLVGLSGCGVSEYNYVTNSADGQFLAKLEEYHAAAAGAHRSHAGVLVALPSISPDRESEQAAAVADPAPRHGL